MNTFRLTLLGLAVASLAACNCGGTSNPDAGTGGGSANGGGSGGTGGSSATGGGAGDGGNPVDAGASLKSGTVKLTQICTSAAQLQCAGMVTASFYGAAVLTAGCTTSTLGSCKVLECDTDGGVALTPPQQNAGTISVAGSLVDGGISLAFSTDRYGLFQTGPDPMWAGGETLSVSATGSTVPAFSAQPVVAPHEITVSAPVCTGGDCGALSRAADTQVQWTGGAGSTVEATITSASLGHYVILTCDSTTSPLTLGAAALAKLGLEDAGYATVFGVVSRNTSTFDAGGYTVTNIAEWTTGSTGTLTVQ